MAVGVPKPKPIPKNLSLEEQQQLVFHPEKNPTRYVAFEHATDYPFEPKAATWSRVNAWWLADASWLSYTQEAETVKAIFRDRAGLPSCELIARDGTECYLAHGADFAIAAFRGTQPDDWNDVLDDVMFQSVAWDEGHVHRGFARGLDVVGEPLGQALKAWAPRSPRSPRTGIATSQPECTHSGHRSSATACSRAGSIRCSRSEAFATSTITTS